VEEEEEEQVSWTDFFKKKQAPEKNLYQKIEDLSIKLYSDDMLKGRIAMIDYLHLAIEGGDQELPEYVEYDKNDKNLQTLIEINKLSSSKDYEDQIHAIYLQLKFMDRVIRSCAIPWLRAGDDKTSARVLRGWEGLFSLAKSMVRSVENQFNRDDDSTLVGGFMDRSEIIFNLKIYLTVCTFKYGLYIVDMSFRNQDVQPAHIAVIMQQGGQDQSRAPLRKTDPLFGNQGQDIRKMIQEELSRR